MRAVILILLILTWHTVELWAVNMKHYPFSSGIQGGEGYGSYESMKDHSGGYRGCSAGIWCLLVSALEGTVLCLNSDTEPAGLIQPGKY